MRYSGFLAVELEVCVAGYEVVGDRQGRSGIIALNHEDRVLVPKVRPRSGDFKQVKDPNLRTITRKLVAVHNASRVAESSTVNARLTEFCDGYGVPQLPSDDCEAVQAFNVPFVLSDIGALSSAILDSEGGPVEASDQVFDALENHIKVRGNKSKGVVNLLIRNPLLAAWFYCINSEVSPNPPCDFCNGPNLARAKSKFCSDYCRDRHKKELMKGRQI